MLVWLVCRSIYSFIGYLLCLLVTPPPFFFLVVVLFVLFILLKSHAHYEFFRSFFEGNVEQVDPLLNRFFDFIDKVCVIPVQMSLLIVIMNSATHDASSVMAAVPSNQSQLYDMAINTVLKAKDEQTWQVAKRVLSKIAFRKMLHKTKPKNRRK